MRPEILMNKFLNVCYQSNLTTNHQRNMRLILGGRNRAKISPLSRSFERRQIYYIASGLDRDAYSNQPVSCNDAK